MTTSLTTSSEILIEALIVLICFAVLGIEVARHHPGRRKPANIEQLMRKGELK